MLLCHSDQTGVTPLIEAVRSGHIDIVRVLLDSGLFSPPQTFLFSLTAFQAQIQTVSQVKVGQKTTRQIQQSWSFSTSPSSVKLLQAHHPRVNQLILTIPPSTHPRHITSLHPLAHTSTILPFLTVVWLIILSLHSNLRQPTSQGTLASLTSPLQR
jgi:ankyrin repeat protein